ncbi:uncharacterized protein LOC114264825 [Camellia sinensis]|uniref:uncharacterized protein LOC114264825 n=1 Tax=Camellia sinensis TaxID=4442 RepID=UPI001035A38D|nr:uncharacterized protein LOC114264825 [Camellia sinensis]
MENFFLLIFLLLIFLSLLMIFLQRMIRLSVGGRKLEGRKSSSGKSGVGSSSHPGYNVKNTTLRASLNKDVTPDNNQNAMRAPQANCDKVRKSNMSKESTAKTRDLTFKSGCGSKTNAVAKSTHLETVKSKVNKVVPSKATRLHRVNSQDSVTGATKAMRLHRVNAQDSVNGATKADDKVVVNKNNRLGNGKENVTSQRPNNGAGGFLFLLIGYFLIWEWYIHFNMLWILDLGLFGFMFKTRF